MIFLDLHKVYGALERSICLEILEGYGVGPRLWRLLQTSWGFMRMVAKAGGYYGSVFKISRGVTQGYPLYPTIFNVVVDAVVRHWVTVMAESAEERGQEGRHQNPLFYEYDSMISS